MAAKISERQRNSKAFDIVIVGAGFFGAVCAHELKRRGFRCLVIDKRDHIGGNCYTETQDGINIHKYGAHVFHTSNKNLWDWINQFVRFNQYRHRLKVSYEGRIYSFPVNLMTLHQLWGVRTPEEARQRLNAVRLDRRAPESLETWALAQVGQELYGIFIEGYTRKQWGKPPSLLPASIIKRLPVRLTYDDAYFDDAYQGIPIGGYTRIFTKLLAGVELTLCTDYLEQRGYFDRLARRVLFTGPIDRFFDYRFGQLEYRSIRFESERLEIPDFQGVAVMNYPAWIVPYTRIVEHKHFEGGLQPVTWITREFPLEYNPSREAFYPLKDPENQRICDKYRELSRRPEHGKYYFGGRLAEYQYYDMHQVIEGALRKSDEIALDLARKDAGEVA